MPVPVNCAVIGALSVLLTVAVPLWLPAADGKNVIATVQVAFAPKLVPQLFDSANGPITAIEIPVNVPELPLLSRSVCAADDT
jgi:hypothetical protein